MHSASEECLTPFGEQRTVCTTSVLQQCYRSALKTNQILLSRKAKSVTNSQSEEDLIPLQSQMSGFNLYFCKHANIQSCIFTLPVLYTQHYIQDTILFLSSSFSAQLMTVCNNLTDSLQPITQGLQHSSKSKSKKKNGLFCFPYFCTTMQPESKVFA